MTLDDLKKRAESFTDETITDDFALSYSSEALDIINTEAGLLLPYFVDLEEVYVAMPDSWIGRLIVPYLCYGIKMNDTSLPEAYEYKNKFDIALMKFKDIARSLLEEEFVDSNFSDVYAIDSSKALDVGWFGGSDTWQ
jgi:hypothetical protein